MKLHCSAPPKKQRLDITAIDGAHGSGQEQVAKADAC